MSRLVMGSALRGGIRSPFVPRNISKGRMSLLLGRMCSHLRLLHGELFSMIICSFPRTKLYKHTNPKHMSKKYSSLLKGVKPLLMNKLSTLSIASYSSAWTRMRTSDVNLPGLQYSLKLSIFIFYDIFPTVLFLKAIYFEHISIQHK